MYCLCTRCIIVNSVQVRSEFGKFAYTAIYMRKCTLWSDNTCIFTQFSLRKKPKYAAYLELWGVQHYVIKRRYIVAAIFFFIPTQLSILCKWQSKVVDPVDPFLHSFFLYIIELVIVLIVFSSLPKTTTKMFTTKDEKRFTTDLIYQNIFSRFLR
jgi:hypothetical protein